MEALTTEQECIVLEFRQKLNEVVGPDDLLPPDGGVRALSPEPKPTLPSLQQALSIGRLATSAEPELALAC